MIKNHFFALILNFGRLTLGISIEAEMTSISSLSQLQVQHKISSPYKIVDCADYPYINIYFKVCLVQFTINLVQFSSNSSKMLKNQHHLAVDLLYSRV